MREAKGQDGCSFVQLDGERRGNGSGMDSKSVVERLVTIAASESIVVVPKLMGGSSI
jgi:hypothetical protein